MCSGFSLNELDWPEPIPGEWERPVSTHPVESSLNRVRELGSSRNMQTI